MLVNHNFARPLTDGWTMPLGPEFGLRVAQTPTDNLVPTDGKRVWCTALMLDRNRMAITAGGLEQTRIAYGLTRLIAQHPGLNINGVKTQRTDGDAVQSQLVLSLLYGQPAVLFDFGEEITKRPWFEPGGRRIRANLVGDLIVIARDRTALLMDVLAIVSGRYEANIETLVNAHYGPEHYGLLTPAGAGGGGRIVASPRNAVNKYTPRVSVTKMRLEFEDGADVRPLLRDLGERGKADRAECGTDWTINWEELATKPNRR